VDHTIFIRRCFDLAQIGKNGAPPNPMVGAVIVYRNKIIGEGFHQKYGTAHAEVNAVASVKDDEKHLIRKSTLYVSLEPCCIHGNTPPCTDLIINNQIPKVVFSCIDQTAGVLGKSIDILKSAGVKVITGILQKTGEFLIHPRTIFTTRKRPFIILKYAVSANGFIGQKDHPVWLSNSISKRLVHRWRSESKAILVGTNTAAIDNPRLDNRLFYGPSPLRIVLDKDGILDHELSMFNGKHATWVITENPDRIKIDKAIEIVSIDFNKDLLHNLLKRLYKSKIGSLLVEGGSYTLQSFIDQSLWDEARVFETKKVLEVTSVKAPVLEGKLSKITRIQDDLLKVFHPC
jgi:diaminohydroxyphosphoribosylaminopyrimidine deaminase/5-amino-6-(5-phosphoribosylamino)uracil reductase